MRRILAPLAAVALTVAAPAHAAPTARDLVEIPELTSLSVAPSGQVAVVREERASVASNSYSLVWWAVDPTGAKPPIRIGGAGDPTFSEAGTLNPEVVRWSADSRWFYYRALFDQAVQVWRARIDGSRVEQVTHDLADVVSFDLDPKTLAVTYRTGEPREAIIAAEKREYDEGILVDGSTEPGQAAYHGMLINGRMASQRLSGHWFSRRGLLGDQPMHERRLTADGLVTELARVPVKYEPAPPPPEEVNSSGDRAFVRDPDDKPALVVRRSGSGQEVTCTDVVCRARRIPGLHWIDGGRRLFLVARQPDHSFVLGLWDPANGRTRRLLTHAGTVGGKYRDNSCEIAGGQVLCILSAAAEPPRLEAIDLASSRRRVLLDPAAEARPRVALRTEAMTWSDGKQDFYGVLFLPEGVAAGARAPLFIQYYACDGYVRGGEGDEYPMPVLAAQGVAALCINTTRIDGVTPETYDALNAYDVAVNGIGIIIDKLAARGLIDPDRVGMGGLSFGSEVTMRMLVKTKRLRAASISSTEMEPIYYWFNRLPGRDFQKTAKQVWGIGALDETPERWKEVSAALSAGSIDAPLLMQLPEQESRYNYELLGRLSMRSVPTEMVIFPDEPHIKFQPRHKLAVYERNIDWFKYWLAGFKDSDPAKRGQYDRWEALQATWRTERTPKEVKGS